MKMIRTNDRIMKKLTFLNAKIVPLRSSGTRDCAVEVDMSTYLFYADCA
jgi:hypothetical protein